MKSIKKILSILMITALVIASVPFSVFNTEKAKALDDAALVLNRPMASVMVTEVTRVAFAQNSLKAPTGGNSVIVKATPSGIPYTTGSYVALGYAGETPEATQITFTPGVTLSSPPEVSCNNSSVTFSAYSFSNGTYIWTVTGGSATVGTTLIFTVTYSYSEVNAVTGKTYTHQFQTQGTSYVAAIATPAGEYTSKRTYYDWGVGSTTKNRSYVASYLLGVNTFGGVYSNVAGDGSVDFTGTASWVTATGWTTEYGVMKNFSGSSAQTHYNVAYSVDASRPLTRVYLDRSIHSTLSDINLRLQTVLPTEPDESDESCTVSIDNISVQSGIVSTFSDETSEDLPANDTDAATKLGIVPFTGSIKGAGKNFLMYFTGAGPQINSSMEEYTVAVNYNTEAQWSAIYVGHSLSLEINSYDKGALRTLIEDIQNTDPVVKTINVGPNGFKGYNPQSWYYSYGWEAFLNAYNAAKSCIDRPDVTQNDIDTCFTNLTSAYEDLTLQSADYTLATAYYNQAMNKVESNYTLASWARLQDALTEYSTDYSVLYQPAVDKMAMDIKAAMDSLVEADADYSAVNVQLARVNSIMENSPIMYNKPASEAYSNWSNLTTQLTKAGCTYNTTDGYVVGTRLKISEQATVDGYVILIKNAIDGLTLSGADYTAATAAENAYKALKLNQITDSIATNLTSSYNALVALHGLDLSRQADIDAAVTTLNYWLANIEYKPADLTQANAMINQANALDRSLYVDFSGVDTAIANLRSKFNLDIRYQSEVDRYTQLLQNEINRLVYVDADYTSVQQAIASAQEIENYISTTYAEYGYTAATYYSNWSEVQNAISEVVYGLKINEQAQVDGYAAAINSAIASLSESYADYTRVNELKAQAYTYISEGESLYTAESLLALSNAYNAVTPNLPISSQATVDGYADALSSAINGLQYKLADYTAVNAQLAIAQSRINDDAAFTQAHPGYTYYTADSMSALVQAVSSVDTNLDIRSQSTVDAYVPVLQAAINGLVVGPADYSGVNNAIASVPADLTPYTSLSVSTLNATVNNVKWGYTADKQSNVDKYASDIMNAIAALEFKAADYSAVNTAIAQAAAKLNTGNYTAESAAALQAAVDAVVYNLDITHQAEVDGFAAAINSAINNLVLKTADYSAVTSAIASVPSNLTLYTDASVANLNNKINAVVYDLDITHQTEVNKYASDITAAIQALIYKDADYSGVTAAITRIPSDLSPYTSESVGAVTAAVNAVVYNLDISHQAEVDGYAEAINTAIDRLQLIGSDYSAVNAAVANAEALIATGLYTDESVAALTAAMDAVVYNLDITHQDEINQFAADINAAIAALVKKTADYSAVNTAVASAEALIATGHYTDASVSALRTKLDAVVYDLDITHQSEVDQFAADVNSAIAALVLKDADYSAVNTAAANGAALIDTGNYTDASVENLNNKINAVVYDLDITHQSEVDQYASDINEAIADLVLKPADYTAVNTAIANAQAIIDEGGHTSESVAAVYDAIDAVVYDLDITHQAEVDQFAEDINAAAAALALNTADYSAVNTAKTHAQSLIATGNYTADSVAAVNDAINAVVYNLDNSHQAEVDQFAADINAAVEALVYKNADYSAVNTAKSKAQSLIATGNYTDESVAALNDVINAVVYDLDITHQNEVNQYAANINTAAAGLVYKMADYSKVYSAISTANDKINTGYYTDESVANLNNKINAVVYNLNITRQNEVNSFANAIRIATVALELKVADYSAVNTAVERGNALIATGDYTSESVAVLQYRINSVIYNLKITEQSRVDGFATAINNAIAGLVFNGADYSAVRAAISAANEAIATGNYTDSSVAVLNAAIDAVVYNLDATHQSQVDQYADSINSAIDGLVLKPADYSAVNTAITNAEALIETGIYTDESVAALNEAIDAVVTGLDITEQAEVDGYAADINAAAEALVLKPADYSAVNTAITEAEALVETGLYTDESAAAVAAAIDAVVYDLDITHQTEVDGYAADINLAAASLVLNPADYTEVDAAVTNAGTLLATGNYSAESVAALNAAIDAVVYDLDITHQAEVDKYAADINAAAAALVRLSADYTAVETAIANAQALIATGIYTEESVAAVTAAIDAVVYDLDATRQAEVDEYASAIESAAAALTVKYADYSAVNTAASEANTLIATGNYTDESVAAVYDAMNAVVYDLDVTHQAEVDTYAQDIVAATQALTLKGADYSAVESAKAMAQTKIALGSYTSESIGNVTDAINAVVYDLDITHQAEVDAYAQAITAAADALVSTGADYSDVAAAISEAQERIATGYYTDETVADLNSAIDAVVNNLDVTYQAQVDQYAADIYAAIDALIYKPADYTALDDALMNASNIVSTGSYTDESVAALYDAINAVDYDLDISHQAEVDAFTQAIIDATNALTVKGADYTAVESAITAARAKISNGYYTDESVAALNAAIDAVVYDLDMSRQSEVDQFAANINAASANLKLKSADYSAVNSAISDAQALIATGYYTESSVADLEETINDVVYNLDITHQSQVNSYAQSIIAATSALVYKDADYSAVEAAITTAQTKIDSGNYTDESVAALNEAINAVDYDLDISHQAEVDGYAQAIIEATAALVLKGADYSAVEAAITTAQTKIDSGNYTDESVAALNEAINAVVYDLDKSHQAEVDGYAQAIIEATAALILKGADYSAVEAAITAAQAKIDTGNYTDESVAALNEAIDAVVTGLDITEQAEVDGYAQAIIEATAALVLKGADYSAVEAAITAAQAKIDTGNYTDESVAALNEAINAVVTGLDITEQAEVDGYAQAIIEATEALVLKGADYSAVEAAITAAQAKIDTGNYTDESVAALNEAINAVVYDLDKTHQSEVDGYAQAIIEATEALVLKGADYSAVEAAITAAQAKIDTGNYTDESVAALNEAINAVVTGLDITEQAEVDGYAQAIIEATEALVLKGADYSAVEAAITAAQAKIDTGNYTDESVAALNEAIDAVVTGLDITEQAEVDGYAQAIIEATEALVLKGADYSAVEAAITAAQVKIDTGNYTDESVAALNETISAVVYDLDKSHQSEVDAYAQNIVNATNDLALKLADYTELQEILNLLDNSSSTIYTITYRNFDEVMSQISAYRTNTVEPNMNLTIDQQATVDEMAATLQAYIDSLEEIAALIAKDGSTTVIDGGYIYGLKPKMTKSAFESSYVDLVNVTVSYSGSNSSRYLGTGTVVTVTSNITGEVIDTYTIVVFGDINGDGIVNAADNILLTNSISGAQDPLEGAYKKAANLNGDRRVNSQDQIKFGNVLSGASEIDQVSGLAV